MAVNQPNFTGTPNVSGGQIPATANVAAPSGTPTASSPVTVFTAGASGSRVEEIDFIATGTTLAGLIQIFVFDGAAYHFFDSVLVSAITPGTTTDYWKQKNTYANLELKSGQTVVCASTVASQLVSVECFGGDF
jgi:hypothetical protein